MPILNINHSSEPCINKAVWDSLDHGARYRTVMNHDLDAMQKLISKGYKIKWSATEKWCTIGGYSFNVPKTVWDARIVNPIPEEPGSKGHPWRLVVRKEKPIEIIDDFSIERDLDEPGEKPYIPMWIVATLRRFGNVAFKDKLPFNLEDLAYYDLEVVVKYTKNGIVLERKQ